MELSTEDVDTLRALEESLWHSETRFSMEHMQDILAPDFFEYGRSGRYYSRADTLSVQSQPINAQIPLPDFDARLLTPDVAQVTYTSVVDSPDGVEIGRRSSIWTREDGRWRLRFHQGTAIP